MSVEVLTLVETLKRTVVVSVSDVDTWVVGVTNVIMDSSTLVEVLVCTITCCCIIKLTLTSVVTEV